MTYLRDITAIYPSQYRPTICEKVEASDARFYRYILEKRPSKESANDKKLLILLSNPQESDLYICNEKMRKIIEFCEASGYNGYCVLSIYPLISSNPANLSEKLYDKCDALYNLNLIKSKIKADFSDIWLAYGEYELPKFMAEILVEILNFAKKSGKNFFTINGKISGLSHFKNGVNQKIEVGELQRFEGLEYEIERLEKIIKFG
ncbi:MAG: DUF1643 domain-containing protein [Campylobacter sp.]|nr:DUF1643 domain-containing protein [Campylobacter sp.]